jgi:hypothetical protein
MSCGGGIDVEVKNKAFSVLLAAFIDVLDRLATAGACTPLEPPWS